jgi:hypothetical protein
MKNWLDKYSDNVPQAQKGKTIYVESKNDPRYKAYQDSLDLYNNYKNVVDKLEKSDYEEKSPINTIKKLYSDWNFAKNKTKERPKTTGLKKIRDNMYSVNDFIPATVNKNLPEQLFSNLINPAGTQIFYKGSVYGENIFHPKKINSKYVDELEKDDENWFTAKPDYRVVANYSNVKPQQQVIVKDQNAPQYKTIHTGEGEGRFEPIQRPKLQAIQNNLQLQGVVSPNMELNADVSGLRPQARIPKSYNVNSQRQNMSGSSDYYDYNQEGVDFETALRAAEAAEAYNQSIQTRYGNSKNPKAQERLKQLRQDLEVIPNYKNGGWLNSYNNDIPQAQNGIEGTMAGLTDRGFNSNGAWGGQFEDGGLIPIAQKGKKVKPVYVESKVVLNEKREGLTKKDNLKISLPKKTQQEKNKKFKKKSFTLPTQPMLSQDKSTPKEAKERKEAFDKVARPSNSQLLMEGLTTLPLMYLSDPIKAVGHVLQDTPLGNDLGNFNKDLETIRTLRYRPRFEEQKKDDRKNLSKIRNQYATNAFINTGLFELGYLSPNVSIPQHLLKSGSIANLMADGLQTQSSLSEGNYGDAVMNMLSMTSKLDNFDASNARKLIFNPSSLNRADKIDAAKDLVNLGFAGQQQTQRVEPFQDVPVYQDGGDVPKAQMGGSLPGASGMMYARQGAPSNGKYAKKTMPSAQNGFSERAQGLTRRDNIKTFKPIQEKDRFLTKAEKEAIKQAELAEKRGDIKKHTPQSKFSKVKEAALNPLTAFGYVARNEDIPENFSRSEDTRNILDNAIDFVNPSFYVQSAINVGENQGQVFSDLSQGNFGDAGINQLMAGVEALNFIPLAKGAKPLLDKGMQQLKNIPTNIAPELRQGLRTAGSSINNIGKKSIITDLKQGLANFNPKNLKSESGLDWMKQWYSDPDFARRYNPTGQYNSPSMQQYILDHLNEYQPKNYIDLLKDKGVKNYGKFSATSGGVSWGVPESIYHNRTMYAPFNRKGLESVKTHELTHLIENNGSVLSAGDEQALLRPFEIPNVESIPENPGFFRREMLGDKPQYFLDPTEIHARMNQARFDLGLTPKDEFTEKMFDKISKDKGWYGMGRYIKDKDGMVNLMNNFWTAAPVTLGAGALYQNSQQQEQTPQYKKGGIIKDDRGQWAHPGEITEIGSNQITMQGVPYNVLGISDTGDTKLMKPGKNYKFKGKKVTEFPMAKNGLRQEQKGLVNLDNLTNFTNYNKPTVGGWLDKY